MLRAGLTLTLAVIILALGIAQMVRPFSSAPISPVLMIVVSLLLFLRYGLVRQRQKRLQLMNQVNKRPLGLTDESKEN